METKETTEVDVEETTTQNEGEETTETPELDLDAEIEAEKNRKPDPEKAREAFKHREEKREQEEEDEDDKPLTRKDLAKLEDEMRQRVTKEVYVDRIQDLALELAENPKEAELIVVMHKNRQFPSNMPLKEQLQEMADLVEAKKLRARNGELGRALKNKVDPTKPNSPQRDPQKGVAPKLDPGIAQALKETGFAYDPAHRAYSRKLPNGKTEIKDVKTGKSQIV